MSVADALYRAGATAEVSEDGDLTVVLHFGADWGRACAWLKQNALTLATELKPPPRLTQCSGCLTDIPRPGLCEACAAARAQRRAEALDNLKLFHDPNAELPKAEAQVATGRGWRKSLKGKAVPRYPVALAAARLLKDAGGRPCLWLEFGRSDKDQCLALTLDADTTQFLASVIAGAVS